MSRLATASYVTVLVILSKDCSQCPFHPLPVWWISQWIVCGPWGFQFRFWVRKWVTSTKDTAGGEIVSLCSIDLKFELFTPHFFPHWMFTVCSRPLDAFSSCLWTLDALLILSFMLDWFSMVCDQLGLEPFPLSKPETCMWIWWQGLTKANHSHHLPWTEDKET